ncbi:thioredoxin family protein [Phytohabitans suffuscus]|uniref:Thioredoxin family protein n=1 Tax=Phytohabitans suffuscus TaxID=624315 RepID=A0A6F8YWH2_9ACTN|nr:thioredoxin family protein [Phytohabitans suffuscus]BCB90406.1 thioredoxin family protein [Phytohabitans suffuscus]
MAVSSFLVPLGTPAPDFALPSVGGAEVKLADVSAPALLVAFLSNHCPYVRHVESALGAFAAEYAGKGLATIGICSNDVVNYPDDGVPGLAGQVERAGFTFPYLVDASQDVAKAYSAACTPDFFLYDGQRRLVYRGAFDEARPKNDVPVTGGLLRAAADAALRGEAVPEPHVPSLGCGIKWRPGNEPPPVTYQ